MMLPHKACYSTIGHVLVVQQSLIPSAEVVFVILSPQLRETTASRGRGGGKHFESNFAFNVIILGLLVTIP